MGYIDVIHEYPSQNWLEIQLISKNIVNICLLLKPHLNTWLHTDQHSASNLTRAKHDEAKANEVGTQEMAVVDFIPRAYLTCMLSYQEKAKPGGIFYPFQHLLVPVQLEISRTPPQRSVQEARYLNLNFFLFIYFFGGVFLCEESTHSSSALFSETSSQIDTALVFSGSNSRQQRSAKSS